MSLSVVGEKWMNGVIKFQKWPDWWELRKKLAGDFSEVRLTPETWETGGLEKLSRILAKFQDMPDLEQHRCEKRTVHGSFLSEDSRCGATPLVRNCVRVNSFGTKSQHILDVEQHPYHMRVNSFGRFDNPDLKTPLLRDGVRVKSFHVMYDYDLSFSALPSSCNTWHRLHLTLRIAFILQIY